MHAMEASGVVCEGIFNDLCTWPAGIFATTIPETGKGLCREGYVFSYSLWHCFLADFNKKASCDCPFSCGDVWISCGPGWTDVCSGVLRGVSKCKPAKFFYDWEEDDFSGDLFKHSVCDKKHGTWIEMDLYTDLPAKEMKRFTFQTGNGTKAKVKRDHMCQRPFY